MAHRFVGIGDPGQKYYLFKADKKTKLRQVLWGDFLTVDGEEDDWFRIVWAPKSDAPQTAFIPKAHTSERRPLEIIFVDVGQGDGAVLISPETGANERILIIDAGQGTNMRAFVNGRFKAYRGFDFEAAVITHPDSDHYAGFEPLFADHRIGFKTVYHNGLVERPVPGTFEKLGGLMPDPATGLSYLRVVETRTAAEALVMPPVDIGAFEYPAVMRAALQNPRIGDCRMLSAQHGAQENGATFLPGFAPTDQRGYTIEVLGPVVEPAADGTPRLRRIASYGETKNGPSVLLRLVFGRFSLLFGGDLNEPAERFLLQHYGGVSVFPAAGSAAYRTMVATAATRFRSEVMKVCHHGSEKVTDAFLEAVNPAAFVISSGDAEGHVHPRPDLLGRLGMFGRGGAPVLLATELQRSTREREDQTLVARISSNLDKLAAAPTPALLARLKDDVTQLGRTNVEVYGAIYVKTDGDRLIAAFKIETRSDTKKWFAFDYRVLPSGELVRVA